MAREVLAWLLVTGVMSYVLLVAAAGLMAR
jgi:hypothetical protein